MTVAPMVSKRSTKADVEVVNVDCRNDGFVALTPDDVADRRVDLVVVPSDEVVVADVACLTDVLADVAEVIVDLSGRSCCISVDDQC